MIKIDATPSTAFTYLRDVITRINRQYTTTHRAYLVLEAKDPLSFAARLDGHIELHPLTPSLEGYGFIEIAKVSIVPSAQYDNLKIEPADTTEWRYAKVLNDIINSVFPQEAR